MNLEILAWLGNITVIFGAILSAKKIYPQVLWVNLTSCVLFGIFSFVNNIYPILVLNVVVFLINLWGLFE